VPFPSFLTKYGAVFVVGILFLPRFLLAPVALLISEEAYYWMYSKYPSLGYLDHPPMVEWVIAAGRYVFGDTELGVRAGTLLLAAGSTWLCYRLAADWCGRRSGLVAAVLFSITPLFLGAGFVTTPDAPLIFFWLLALLAVTRAYRTGSYGWWLVAGVATGLGFVSKYPALFLVPCTFLFLLSDRRGRRRLLSPGPWLALCIAVIVAWPVISWNAQNEWASFRFQFARRLAGQGGLTPARTVEWVAVQFGLLSPLVFVLFTAAWWIALRRFRRDRTGRWRFAACFSIPWLAVCVWHGLFSKVNINWPLPAYLGLLPVAALLVRARISLPQRLAWLQDRRLARRYTAMMIAVDVLVLLFVSVRVPLLPRPDILAPWDELGEAAEVAEDAFAAQTGSEPFIIADGKYKLASELAFYMRDWPQSRDWSEIVPATIVMGGGLNYANWHQQREFFGRNAIYITKDLKPLRLEMLRACFARVEEPQKLFSHAHGLGRQQDYWVICLWDFRGVSPEAGGLP
jgi:dolichol-phosphate mannosyltransferase